MVVDFSRTPWVVARKLCELVLHAARTGMVLFALTLASSAAQLPSLTKTAPAPSPSAPEQVSDPLGRSTPRGTILGFIKAANRNDFVTAASYLQITGKQKIAKSNPRPCLLTPTRGDARNSS
jgi:hypothetical protein